MAQFANMQKIIFGKKVLNVTTVKLISKKEFEPLIKGKNIPILRFVTFYYLELAPKIQNNSKFSKEQEIFANWTEECK